MIPTLLSLLLPLAYLAGTAVTSYGTDPAHRATVDEITGRLPHGGHVPGPLVAGLIIVAIVVAFLIYLYRH